MENQRIEVENLQIGDEVIVGGSGDINYFKILREPQKRTDTNLAGGYKAIKVQVDYEPLGKDPKWNRIRYYDFNYRTIWLVKRKNEI